MTLAGELRDPVDPALHRIAPHGPHRTLVASIENPRFLGVTSVGLAVLLRRNEAGSTNAGGARDALRGCALDPRPQRGARTLRARWSSSHSAARRRGARIRNRPPRHKIGGERPR